MSKIKNSGLDQYGAEPFEQQQFGTAGVKGVNPFSLQNNEFRRVFGSMAPTAPTWIRQCDLYMYRSITVEWTPRDSRESVIIISIHYQDWFRYAAL